MRRLLVFAAACSFTPGKLTDAAVTSDSDAPMTISDAPMVDVAPTADARVCPAAPTGCTMFQCASSTSCYYVCGTATTGKQSYSGAVSSCANPTLQLGCIATVNDQAENNCIAAASAPSFPNALLWIGYEQAPGSNEPDGGWDWHCGTSAFTAPNWGDFEPNDTNNDEDCSVISDSFGTWLDVDCSGSARFVCELP